MGPIEEELKEAAGASGSGASESISDDAFLRSSPDSVPFARDYANGYRPPAQPAPPVRRVRRSRMPTTDSRQEFDRSAPGNPRTGLESSGRRDYPFGESSYPAHLREHPSTSERRKAAGPRPLTGFDAIAQKLQPFIGKPIEEVSPEINQLAGTYMQGVEMYEAMGNLNKTNSRTLSPSGTFSETDPRSAKQYGPRLARDAKTVEAPIPEAISEDEENWVVPGDPNSRDWANGFRPPAEAPAPLREVDRLQYPDKDDRPEFEPRPSANPHGELEPSGRRDYPMGENYVPIAQQGDNSTSEKFRAARYRSRVADRERRAALTPEARALEDADKQIAGEDRASMRAATKPFRQVRSADTGQATMSSAGYAGQKRWAMFAGLGAQRQQAMDTIAAKQAKIDGTRFRWGNIGNWFSGLFRNRGRRRDIATAQGQLAALDQQAAAQGISDFSDETGAALRSQAELEARIPMTGGESPTFQAARAKTQETYKKYGNRLFGERPLLQRAGIKAARSLGERAQPDGSYSGQSLVSSSVDGLIDEQGGLNQVNSGAIAKWGEPAASAGATIPEASVDEEDADEIAERAEAQDAERSRRELLTDPLPRATARMSGAIDGSGEQLDTGTSRRPVSVGGSVGAARGKLATWEKLERRFDDADLEHAVQYGRRNLIGAREVVPPTAIPQDTSALRNQAIYDEDPTQFGFHAPLLPDGANPGRRRSMEVPQVSGDPLATTDDDVRTAQDSLGDRLRGRDEGTGTLEGGRDFFGTGSIGGYRSSIGGYRDAIAQNPNEFDFNFGGRANPQGPKYKSSADIFARANRPKPAEPNPLLMGQVLFGVVSTNQPKAKAKPTPVKKEAPPAPPAKPAAPRRGILKNKGEGQSGEAARIQADVDDYIKMRADPDIPQATKDAKDTVFRHQTTEGSQAKQYGMLLNFAAEKGRDIDREQKYIDDDMWDDAKDGIEAKDYTRMQLSRDAQAEVRGAAAAYGVSERAKKLAEFNARPDGLAPSAGRNASSNKGVSFGQLPQKKSGGSSWFKPWTWGTSKAAWQAPRGEGAQVPDYMQGPVQQAPVQQAPINSRPAARVKVSAPKPPREEEKVDAEVLESARQAGIDAAPTSTPANVAPVTPQKSASPRTPGDDFRENVWSGYDPARHLLPGEKAQARHDLGPGARESRFPVHEDPNFEPSDAYMDQLRRELQESPAQPGEMIQPQQPRRPVVPSSTSASRGEKPEPTNAAVDEIGSADTLRIMFERLGLNKRGR